MCSSLNAPKSARWFVLRDLKRVNSKEPAYKLFEEKGIEFFTPMKSKLMVVRGKRVRKDVPCIPDLLFVHETREKLDSIIGEIPTIQYRWVRNKYREPMVVSDVEMERFMVAVATAGIPKYYLPEEITSSMLHRKIRIVGGLLDGYEGTLLTVRGSKVKRLLIELPNLVSVGVDVNPDFIQFI